VVVGGSMLACGGDERLELRTGAMSLSEDGLASTWDYAINNPLLTQQHGFPPWPPVRCPSLALTGLAPARAPCCAILEGPRNTTLAVIACCLPRKPHELQISTPQWCFLCLFQLFHQYLGQCM
jgi:hypothetical protein